jgi:hypothetical protein
MKLGIGTDFSLLTTNKNGVGIPADQKESLPDEILEWREQMLTENPVISRSASGR